jgi:hypothetical protein
MSLSAAKSRVTFAREYLNSPRSGVVVEGAGQIGERTTRTLVDARSGNPIGKVEEWPLVECVRLRVIGLHAGPLAIAPHRR